MQFPALPEQFIILILIIRFSEAIYLLKLNQIKTQFFLISLILIKIRMIRNFRKENILIIFFISLAFHSRAQVPAITEAAGWLESVYIEWLPVTEAQSYNVYYTGNGVTDNKIDTQLIRSYGSYFRADIPGLKAGNYTLKVVPVIAGVEGAASVSQQITVLPHDRNGFAFHNGRVPGAYKADGTPRDNAVILYITENNKNTVSMTVTGANANPCVGLQAILDGFKKGKDTRPLIVRLIGQITDFSYMLNGDVVIENDNNASSYITIEGVGDDAVADGWGLRIKNATNIEVRNIGFMNCNSGEGDNVGLQQNNDYIWVHNCDMFYGNAGSDADQIKGDGALDCKGSTYVTFSYNHFWDSGKSNLLGLSEDTTVGLYISYHHNWYDHSDSRHPRVRFYSAHVYNNYYDGIAKYGVGATMGSSVFVENNFFRNCKYPMLTSMQGTDIYYGGGGTFSGEDGGTIKAFNNIISGQTRYVPYDPTNFPVEFDAIEASTRDQVISNTIKSKKGANVYNNFDTDASLYVKIFIPDEPEAARNKVMLYAGRVTGGDLKWTFNNTVDDASYAVNTGLKAALTGYKTKLVSVQGENSSSVSTHTLGSSGNTDQTVTAGTAISEIVLTWGGEATDVTVTGLPASGISYVKNPAAKTVTITGIPTATVIYTVSTTGTTGVPVSVSGMIEVITSGGGSSFVHNFTTDGKNSTFYSISGNLSTTKGTVMYENLTLTQCLKIESTTNISFTASQEGVLTLVFIEAGKNIKIDGVSCTSDASGIVTLNLPAGTHTITKADVMNLFYMKFEYKNSTSVEKTEIPDLAVYPNPVVEKLHISSGSELKNVEIFTLAGQLIKQINGKISVIDFSTLSAGNYLIKIYTREGVISRLIIKN